MTRIAPASYSAYAPLRYEVTRPFASSLSAKFAANYFPSKVQRSNFFFKEILPEILDSAVKARTSIVDSSVEFEVDNLKAYTEFLISGRIIYDFHKKLSVQLAEKPLDESSLASVIKPYEAFYLHFGDVSWPKSTVSQVEGAFVSWGNPAEDPDYVTIHVIKPKQFADALFWKHPDRELSEHFTINVSDTPAGIDRQFATIRKRWKKSAEAMGFDTLLNDKEIAAFTQHMKAVFTLVVNCMLYLSEMAKKLSEAESISDLAKHEGAHAREPIEPSEEAAADQQSNKDYLKVNLIGAEFANHQGKHFLTGSNHKKAAHDRKGHYRNQRYGPKWSLTRQVFINPTKIHSETDVLPGQIFVT